MLKFRNSHLRALPLMGLNNCGLHVPGISISQCPQKCGECCSLLDNPHSALSYPAIFTRKFFFFYMTQSYLQLQAQAVYKQLQHQLCPSCHYRLYPTVLRYRPQLYLHAHLLLQSVWCLCHYRMGLKGTHIYRNASQMIRTLLSFILPWAYMQWTKQLKMIAEATSFQLTCKIIVFFCGSWVSFGKNDSS